MNKIVLTMIFTAIAITSLAGSVKILPEKVSCAIADKQEFQIPDCLQLTGWIGSRIDANEKNRLVKIDPARLLEGYRKRPGRQSWEGEHVGKWLHAATLAWVNTGDQELRKKLDYTVTELVKCQEADGYLGTYSLDGKPWPRWSEWDVWAHKYNLIGLITYIRYTGNQKPLPACRKMADLLCKTFGDEPGKLDINNASQHVGMAPGSVMEPMVLLYRLTGEPRYLDFCNYLMRVWETSTGPHIISRLLDHKPVFKVGNGKAYEMLSCLNGVLELYRTTGDPKLLEACRNAWQDIVDHRLYITGAASYREHFHDDYDFPNVDNPGETCVTTTWVQFNAQLLRLTGEARFAEQLEHVVLNQLFGAQHPDGTAWCYYVPLEGKKPYSAELTGHCCLSSGPRAIALIPTFASSVDADGVVVNLYEAGTARLTLKNGKPVTLTTETKYPSDGKIVISVDAKSSSPFAFKVRVPAWCPESSIKLNGKKLETKAGADGYTVIKRTWEKGDKVELNFKLEQKVIMGDHLNEGKVAIMYGPLVLAADEAMLGADGLTISSVAIGSPELTSLAIKPEPAPESIRSWPNDQVYLLDAVLRRHTSTARAGVPIKIQLTTFADASSTGKNYKVWLPLCSGISSDLLIDGDENRSRQGNVEGSINDENNYSFVVTFDGKPAAEDWFAVTLDEPVTVSRVVYAHGKTFPNGGWFDASSGKPRIQIQTTKAEMWEDAGELKDYPATTPTDAGKLKGGETFNCQLSVPVKLFGIRVVGKPAGGDKPEQSFSSCAEIQAFAK